MVFVLVLKAPAYGTAQTTTSCRAIWSHSDNKRTLSLCVCLIFSSRRTRRRGDRLVLLWGCTSRPRTATGRGSVSCFTFFSVCLSYSHACRPCADPKTRATSERACPCQSWRVTDSTVCKNKRTFMSLLQATWIEWDDLPQIFMSILKLKLRLLSGWYR